MSRQVVQWFLATDSLALRHQAKMAHGDKLVTSLELPLAHTREGHTHAARTAGKGAARTEPKTRWTPSKDSFLFYAD